MEFTTALPIDAQLADIRKALSTAACAVLVAPPGAGKTTRVPLALLEEDWLQGRKIIVLEPRRIAARGAAARMAETLGERVGQTIGLRARLSSRIGPKTRIEVVTEGVFTRMILDDPELNGIGAVLFDEFHERSLDADLGLALTLEAQRGLREDLRILAMSATLDGARVASLLGPKTRVIEGQGRAFPVETRYLGRIQTAHIEDQMTDAILKAVRAERGSILAFLPGQGEIRRVKERLNDRMSDPAITIAPLYGAMEMAAQNRAVAPAVKGTRKIVLATAIAETSLTIDGVRVVVDSGLVRVPRFEPDVGVTRLETMRVSRASADQRRGRAGRTEPGVCYRLWDEPQTASLQPFAEPEIRSADLSALVLNCAEWGVVHPLSLSWLDPPSSSALEAARAGLMALRALDGDGRITSQGKRMRALPLPPRLARMVLAAAEQGVAKEAAYLAAILVERGLGGNDTDLAHRLDAFRRDRAHRAVDMRRVAEGWAKSTVASITETVSNGSKTKEMSLAALLALAFPERIAKARGTPGQFLLANGRGANLDPADPLARHAFLVVAELQGKAAATRILLAAPANEAEVLSMAGDRITEDEEVIVDAEAGALRARRVRRLEAITLSSETCPVTLGPETAGALAGAAAARGLEHLPWSKAQKQLRDRIAFLREAGEREWPDLSNPTLSATVCDWLAPFLSAKSRLSEITADDLGQALDTLLPWNLKRRLDEKAPTHFEAPTGNRHAIDYDGAGAPALHIRVQELFGLKAHPAIAGGKLPLTVNLLSPAGRPIQITRDLPGFWSGSWAAVKADMKGRYPKHVWPDDPANAAPTARAKPRNT